MASNNDYGFSKKDNTNGKEEEEEWNDHNLPFSHPAHHARRKRDRGGETMELQHQRERWRAATNPDDNDNDGIAAVSTTQEAGGNHAAVDLQQFRNTVVGHGYQAKHVVRQKTVAAAVAAHTAVPVGTTATTTTKEQKKRTNKSTSHSRRHRMERNDSVTDDDDDNDDEDEDDRNTAGRTNKRRRKKERKRGRAEEEDEEGGAEDESTTTWIEKEDLLRNDGLCAFRLEIETILSARTTTK